MSLSGILRRGAAVLTSAVALVVAAGCASVAGHHTSAQSVGHPVSSASTEASTAAARRAEAEQDAAYRLTAFRPPPGATRLIGPPPGSDVLIDPGGDMPTVAAATSWWQVSGQPQAVVTRLATPSGGSRGDTWGDGDASTTMYAIEFDWPRNDVLVARNLTVQAARIGGTTVLRVDATSMWQPPRPSATLVPADAPTLIVSYRSMIPHQGSSSPPAPRGPLTVTDHARIAAVAAEVNAAPVEPYSGTRPCPAPIGELDLSFRSATGVEVASVQASGGGCDDISVQVGTATTTLVGAGGLTAAVFGTLHLTWATGR